MKVITQLEFELAYNYVVVQHVSHYTVGTFHDFAGPKIGMINIHINE